MRRCCVALLVSLLGLVACKKPSQESESVEILAVLQSSCAAQAERGSEEPVRYVYTLVHRTGSSADIQYREFDANCRSTFTATGQWTLDQFDSVKRRLRGLGIKDGQVVAPGESSGSNLPISFLKVRSSDFNVDLYSMYLRFRWAGKMETDPTTAKALDAWRDVLRDATPAVKRKFGIEEIARVAGNCAADWPTSFNSSVCSEARQAVHP